jgi:hypothetical protein
MTKIEIFIVVLVIMLILYVIYSFAALYFYEKKMFGRDNDFNFSKDNVFIEERYEYFTCDDNGNIKKGKTYVVYVRKMGKNFSVMRFFDKKKAINCMKSLIKKESEE